MTLKERVEIKLINHPAVYGLARSCFHKAKATLQRIAPNFSAAKNNKKSDFFVSEHIALVDIKDSDRFSYSSPEGIAVIMPCLDTARGLDAAQFLYKRAGIKCVVIVAYDSRRQGFIKTLNRSEERRVGKECRSRWSPYH